MNRLGRWQDLVLPVAIIASVFVILVPLPAGMLDMLLSINVTLGVIVLLTTIYVRTPLEFSIFPSLLLATHVAAVADTVVTDTHPRRAVVDAFHGDGQEHVEPGAARFRHTVGTAGERLHEFLFDNLAERESIADGQLQFEPGPLHGRRVGDIGIGALDDGGVSVASTASAQEQQREAVRNQCMSHRVTFPGARRSRDFRGVAGRER